MIRTQTIFLTLAVAGMQGPLRSLRHRRQRQQDQAHLPGQDRRSLQERLPEPDRPLRPPPASRRIGIGAGHAGPLHFRRRFHGPPLVHPRQGDPLVRGHRPCPRLAQSARKLWQKAAPGTATGSASQPPDGTSPGDAPRFAALEGQLSELGLRQQEGAELLAALAAQNAELVDTTHRLQQRVRQLAIALGVTAALAVAAFLVALLGGK